MNARPAFEPELVMTEAEYLAFEDAAETKHEFVAGHVYDWPGYDSDAQGMVGARLRHNILQVNLVTRPAGRRRGARRERGARRPAAGRHVRGGEPGALSPALR
jgi:hypothetical protein